MYSFIFFLPDKSLSCRTRKTTFPFELTNPTGPSGKVQHVSGTIPAMYFTKGIEAVATITELRSNTSELLDHAKGIESGILIQKNNEPYAVLISYHVYEKLINSQDPGGKRSAK